MSQTHPHPDPPLQEGEGDKRPVEVVAGVLQDARGRILLARRTEGRDLAGLWEFPGGKRETGETPEAALARELHEELGIEVQIGEALICVPHRYPHKRLQLDVRRIASWRGTPKGHEGQALVWVPQQKLATYSMPAADRPVVAALLQADRYLVTPAPVDDAQWLRDLRLALEHGIRRVQLRGAPALNSKRWHTLVLDAVARCRATDADVLLNGDIVLAKELGTGVHLRAAQLRALDRRPLGDDSIVAASCHDVEDLRRAEQLGCDFAVLGPVHPTPTHPEATGMGWDAFAAMREEVSLPIYGIGGTGIEEIPVARAHGAQGVAAIRALWPRSDDPHAPVGHNAPPRAD